MQSMFAAQGDSPVNWDMAEDIARRTAAGQAGIPGTPEPTGTPGDPGPTEATTSELRQAAQVARLWLDPVISVDVPSTELAVYSRGTWLHRTLPRWKPIVEPVAKYMAGAIGEAIAAQMGQMGEFGGADMPMPGGDPAAMMERIGGTMFGVQFGHAIGSLAREAAGTTDLGLPLGRDGEPALVAANVEDLVSAHSLDPGAARIFLAAREIAHTALFASAPWLGKALFSAIEDYSRGITLDLDALDDMVRDLDLSDPEAMQARRPEEMFVFTRRASQERAPRGAGDHPGADRGVGGSRHHQGAGREDPDLRGDARGAASASRLRRPRRGDALEDRRHRAASAPGARGAVLVGERAGHRG